MGGTWKKKLANYLISRIKTDLKKAFLDAAEAMPKKNQKRDRQI